MDTLDKGIIHIAGWTKWDSMRFHHVTQKSAQFEIFELFISGILHLICLDVDDFR